MLFTQNVKKNSMMIINNHLLYLIVDRGFIFHLKKLSQSPTIWVVHIVWKMRKKLSKSFFYSLIEFFLIAKILQISCLLQKWNRVYKELVYLNRYKNRFLGTVPRNIPVRMPYIIYLNSTHLGFKLTKN